MRSAVFVALLVTSAALLAGCSGKDKESDFRVTCPDGKELNSKDFGNVSTTPDLLKRCTGAGSKTNTTSLPPNQMPVLKLKITDGTNETKVTLVDGNLTFDAAGSSDPDGTITGIAVTVTDSNTTRTATLYDPAKKTFKTATFLFDRPGVVNVTVAMVDDRAGFTVNQTKLYVNELQVGAAQTIQLPNGADTISSPCDIGDEIVGAQFWKQYSFNVANGATLIEAIATTESDTQAGSALLTICGPDKSEMSEPGNPTVASGGPFPAATGIATYYVGMTLEGGATTEVTPTVLVHYEPGATATFTAA